MQKNIYITLSLITVSLFAYTTLQAVSLSSLEIQQNPATTLSPDPKKTTSKVLTTSQGKKIEITETNPIGESLSTITLTLSGFEKNDPIVLEKNKLLSTFLFDLNKDSSDELIIVTQTQSSGSYGEATIFTSTGTTLTPVSVPALEEKDLAPGGLFEGYMGHDTYSITKENTLIREFPTYQKEDTNDKPTGPTKKIIYTLVTTASSSFITFSSDTEITHATSTQQALEEKSPTLSSTPWVWNSTTGDGVTSLAPEGGKFVIMFEKNKTLLSSTDCNPIKGTYTYGTTSLSLTMKKEGARICDTSREATYKTLLSFVTGYSIQKQDLVLTIGTRGTMTFTKK
jgi:hypothetical protein